MTEILKRRRAFCDVFNWASTLQGYLENRGMTFDRNGMPRIARECFAKNVPLGCDMLPATKGWRAKDKLKTVICMFERDEELYRHARNIVNAIRPGGHRLKQVLSFYRQFLAVCGFDFSACGNNSVEEQEMNLLLNALFNAFFAVNNILLVGNFRIGSQETFHLLSAYPKGVTYAVGTLGCVNHFHAIGEVMLRSRLLILQPSELLIYGPLRPFYENLLKEENISFRHFLDYRSRTQKVRKEVK